MHTREVLLGAAAAAVPLGGGVDRRRAAPEHPPAGPHDPVDAPGGHGVVHYQHLLR